MKRAPTRRLLREVVEVRLRGPLVLEQPPLRIRAHACPIRATKPIAILVKSSCAGATCVSRHLPVVVLGHYGSFRGPTVGGHALRCGVRMLCACAGRSVWLKRCCP